MNETRRLLLRGLATLPFATLSPTAFAAAGRNRYLVLVELKGANDGLNTLVPYESDRYHAMRPRIGVKSNDIIPIGKSEAVGPLGLNTSMAALDNALGQDLAIIPGLGYPNQNRSHFKSIALWETGGDGNKAGGRGWITDALEQKYETSAVSAHGASFSGALGLFTKGEGLYVSMTRLKQMASVQASGGGGSGVKLMNLINKRKSELSAASESLLGDLDRFPASYIPRRMPSNDLATQLTDALRVIGAEIPLPVLHVRHGSFDTHEAQIWQHPRLLQDLSDSLGRFRKNLITMDRWDDVLIMTYSEFGRRAAENGAEGTDHGTASTHFLMGGRVTPGLYGTHPSLDSLIDGDMQHSMDYRALYDQVCTHWIGREQNRFERYRDDALRGVIG